MRPPGHLENRAALESSSEAPANARDASAGFSELLGNVYAEQGAARAAGAPVNHRLLSLCVSPSFPNALGPVISGQQLAPGVNAPPEQAAGADQTDGSSALLASSSRAPLTRPILKLETDLIEAGAPSLREAAQDTPQNISGAAPMALEIPAEVRAPVPVTLTIGFDGVAKIDSAIMSGLAPAPAPTFALSSSIAGGLERPGRRSEPHADTDAYPTAFLAAAAVAADRGPLPDSVARTQLSAEARHSDNMLANNTLTNNMLVADGTHLVALPTALRGKSPAAREGESPRGELAFAARLAENVASGDASQPAARPGSVPLADGGSHPAQAPLSRPEPHSTHDPAAGALPPRAGQFDPSETGAVTSVNGVHEASDEPRHAALESATSSDDSGSGRTKTDLEAGEKFRVEASAREAASKALEPSAGKPASASVIAALEPARAATLDRNPDRGGAPQASSAQASIAAAAAEKSAAMVRNPEPARDICVRLAPDQKTRVEVRLIDRGGEVRVAVRSTDPQLAETMRAGLSDLSERLSQHGFKTDIWHPESAGTSTGFSSRPGPESSGREDSGQHGGSGQNAGRNPGQQQHPGQKPGQHPGHQQRRPQWVEELEHTPSLTSTLKRSKKA